MDSRSERAARRRRTWTGGVACSHAEAEEADIEFWARATPAERVRGLTELVNEMYALGANDGSAPDFRDLLEEFDHAAVESVIVGG